MKLNKKLLEDFDYNEKYNGFHEALGLYDTMQFVLRLRTDIHNKVNLLPAGIVKNEMDFDNLQAYSTYLHETIHWWQHIGSISGLILSLSYPAQTHLNKPFFEDFIKNTGKIKSIEKYNRLHATEFDPNLQNKEFNTINFILNNFFDIEFFKHITINPKSIEKIKNDKYFESIGNSFYITYSAFVNLLASCFDTNFSFLPNLEKWEKEFSKLNTNRIKGHYYGSDIYIAPFGLKEIYEGQARFTQIQFLYFASNKNLTWDNFENLGMLSGVYFEAFKYFLEILEENIPETIDNPLVGLFLLVCDISINPGEGFPNEIQDFEQFINNTDPGIRFIRLCNTIKKDFPEVKSQIIDYSSSEYFGISLKLCNSINIPTPMEISEKINTWSSSIESIIKLMEEEKEFVFDEGNFPIRLIFSRFIKFQQDKLKNPAFFCWSGIYKTVYSDNLFSKELFNEHEALFIDGIDGDIYPRLLPNKSELNCSNTMDKFYSWITLYDLTRQWIINEGEFKYDYLWLTSKFPQNEVEKWAKEPFKLLFKCSPDDFTYI
ncbi:hypothetical protein ACOAJ8_09250 [Arcobacter cryaerophilus gv. pseudocryaerophilus]